MAAVRALMARQLASGEIAWVAGLVGVIMAVFGALTMRLYNRK